MVRLAKVPDQVVGGRRQCRRRRRRRRWQAAVEAELSPVLPLTPELPHQIARNFEVLIGLLPADVGCLVFGNSHWQRAMTKTFRQPNLELRVKGSSFVVASGKRDRLLGRCSRYDAFPSADAVAYATRTAGRVSGLRARMICKSISCLRPGSRTEPIRTSGSDAAIPRVIANHKNFTKIGLELLRVKCRPKKCPFCSEVIET